MQTKETKVKYETPEIVIEKFDLVDLIAVDFVDDGDGDIIIDFRKVS